MKKNTSILEDTRLMGLIAIAISTVALLLSSMAMTLHYFPESRIAGFLAHPIDTARVAYICAGRERGERVGDLYCHIDTEQ